MVKKLPKVFTKKNCKKLVKKKPRIEEVLKRKGDKFYSNGKGMIITLVVGLIKNIS